MKLGNLSESEAVSTRQAGHTERADRGLGHLGFSFQHRDLGLCTLLTFLFFLIFIQIIVALSALKAPNDGTGNIFLPSVLIYSENRIQLKSQKTQPSSKEGGTAAFCFSLCVFSAL